MNSHFVLGAGGVGGLIGATLAHAGLPVTLLVRREALADQPPQLELEANGRKFTVPVSVAAAWPTRHDNDHGNGASILWVAVKATQLEAALAGLSSGARPAAVVPLLNGVDHVELLRRRFGRDAVVPATIAVEAERLSPGVIVQRSPFARLKLSSAGRGLLAAEAELFAAAGFECQFVDDEPTLLWSKLVFLAPFALSTSAAADAIGAVMADPARRRLLHDAVGEACAVAAAEGANVAAAGVLAMLDKLPPTMRSSMQRDLAAGRPLELDAIAGPVLRGAQRHGLPAPATQSLAAQVAARS